MNNRTKEAVSLAILDRALQAYNPTVIVDFYSGGYDSMIVAHLVSRWRKSSAHSANVITASVDTLLNADGWREFVTTSARAIGVTRFEIASNPELDSWIKDVQERGFAYRPHQHKIYFYYLKQRAFREIVARYKKHRTDRVMLLTGVRRAESKVRAQTPEVERVGSSVYVHPLVHWSEEDCYRYRMDHELPINPFYDTFHNSGDCLCNWHNQISLPTVQKHAPNAYKTIKPLHDLCQQTHGYGYDSEPSRYAKQELAGQLRLIPDIEDVPNLCAGCSRETPTNAAMDELMLQRMQW